MKDAVEVSRGSTKEGTHGRDRLITIYAERSTAPAVGPMSSSKSGLLLSKTASTSNRPGPGPLRLGLTLSCAAGRPAAAGALGVAEGEREENEAELGVTFGPNPGAIVHFSTSSLTRPPKRLAARAASQRLPRPFGPRQPQVGAKLRNYPENFGRHTATHSTLRVVPWRYTRRASEHPWSAL
jgi:hypothetical protein